ncbi:MAG: hypothetical protein CVU55_10460 [Deltaproteobacteria bacterium HGW-Deltaproteobacteria-13]|nr:MAG: hypothetical protein CVU55_10460 [Deltaproteobacteria bacterium HGW-Deltaproteobacteria-13]
MMKIKLIIVVGAIFFIQLFLSVEGLCDCEDKTCPPGTHLIENTCECVPDDVDIPKDINGECECWYKVGEAPPVSCDDPRCGPVTPDK